MSGSLTGREDVEIVRRLVFQSDAGREAFARLEARLGELRKWWEETEDRVAELEQEWEELHQSYVEQLAETTEAWTKFSSAEARVEDALQALKELEEAGSDPAPLRVVRFALTWSAENYRARKRREAQQATEGKVV